MVLSAAPVATAVPLLLSTTDDLRHAPTPSRNVLLLCRRILEQNLLKAGETFIVATPYGYDQEYVQGLILAAGEIGAVGMHVAVVSPPPDPTRVATMGRRAAEDPWPWQPSPGVTDMHWKLYAQADLLISCDVGSPMGAPSAAPSNYYVKVGDHPYRTDAEFLNRTGSKTRWLSISEPVGFQWRWFPTQELRSLTREGAGILEGAKEIRVTSKAGSDWTCSNETRPGHAQYGIADSPGRWDNFTFGCAACAPLEDSTEGVLVLEPGDFIWPEFGGMNLFPGIIDETITLTYEGGYVTNIEGGTVAGMFERLLASYDDPESYGTSHFGWGTHTGVGLGGASAVEILNYHHNQIGSLLFALGMNYGHGLGVDYSGLGETTRIAPNHTHFTMFNATCYVDGEKVVEDGKLLT